MHCDPSQMLWTEKYRPASVEDCVIPERVKKIFKEFVNHGEFPSLLLSGSPGLGKTTLAKALCQDIGVDWILINASNERGIDTLRTTITNFASTVSFNDAKIKAVILDEADYASPLLQAGLRAAIEDFSKTCRFIFTCNYPNKIIEAIHSRCSNVSLSLEPSEKAEIAVSFLRRMEGMLKNEGVAYERKAVASLIEKHFPDFRRIINELQRLSRVGKIDVEVVSQLTEDVNIKKLVSHLKERDFGKMRAWVAQNIENDVNALFRKIYDNLSSIVEPVSIPEIVILLAQYQYRGSVTPDPEINMVAFLTEVMASAEFK